MLSAHFHSDRRIELVRTSVPTPAVDQVLVRVAACCVCGSDLRTYLHGNARVKSGAVLGHELAGTIAAVGALVSSWKVGDRVAVGADVPCGACPWCRRGLANSCRENLAIGYQFAGGFAEYILLDARIAALGPMARVPDNVSLETACLAEPLACCLNGFDRMLPLMGEFSYSEISTVIFGAGPIGCLLALLAGDLGLGPTVVLDTAPARGRWLEKFPTIRAVHLDSAGDWRNAVEAATGHPRLIFTACSTIEAAHSAVSIAGTHDVVNFFGGLPKGQDAITLSPNLLHYSQATFTGSHGSNPSQFTRAMDLLASGRLPVEGLISHRFALADIQTAFQSALQRDGLKTLIRTDA